MDWKPEDDEAIDRLLLRIDNTMMTRGDWDAIEEEIAKARQSAQTEADALRERVKVLEVENAAMWRNGVTNTAALIDQARRAHPIAKSNQAFRRFDADLNSRIERWFSFTRSASPASYEEAENEWKRFAALGSASHD